MKRPAASPSFPLIERHLSWAQASLELCLDMERNQSDSRFAKSEGEPEIAYVFDESVFELFIGGVDEVDADRSRIYQDRRRSVGIFNTREWRETPTIGDDAESRRIALNRQTAILTGEWLFSGNLPAMRDRTIYISNGHLKELRSRWRRLIDHYRDRVRRSERGDLERDSLRRLLEDQVSPNFDSAASGRVEPEFYISGQREPLKSDLHSFWSSLRGAQDFDRTASAEDFWRFAFSRRLASELAGMQAIGPLAQLLRINSSVSGRLRLLDHAGVLDEPDEIPSGERQSFWRDRLEDEVQRRTRLGYRTDRSEAALVNDAATLAMVQSLANSAARAGDSKRFVLVTADTLLVDTYRAWHCHSALEYEPFVIRPVRHFAPLLNAVGMADPAVGGDDEEMRERRDILPSLQEAIDPFLLTLNLSPSQLTGRRLGRGRREGEDSGRWPREMFALRLQRLLDEYRVAVKRGDEDADRRLQEGVADKRFFSLTHFEKLASAQEELNTVAERGRRIESSAIGLGYHALATRLEAIRDTADLLDRFADGDDIALAVYIQEMVDELGSSNLELHVRLLDIARELHAIVSAEGFRGLGPRRVPLALRIVFHEADGPRLIATEAEKMIAEAIDRSGRSAAGRPRVRSGFVRDLHGGDLGYDGGYRLYALYTCVALRLGSWDMAQHNAEEALRRVRRHQPDHADVAELEYLLALAIRFQLGAGIIRDATASDISFERYQRAKSLLLDRISGGEAADARFVDVRAASELVALLIFGSIWSLASWPAASENQPRMPDGLFREELGHAWALSGMLRDAGRSGRLDDDGAAGAEVLEQVRANAAAIYCLSRVAKSLVGGDGTAFIDDTDMLAWLDAVPPSGESGDLPPITCFYTYWYHRLRSEAPGDPRPVHFDLALRIDRLASQLFHDRAMG